MLAAIVSQNSFVLVFVGVSHNYRARYVAKNGVSHRCASVKLSAKGGVALFWGSANPPEKVSRDMGYRTLIFFSLPFWKTAGKTTKKARISSACRTPKILGKEWQNAQIFKEFLEKENPKDPAVLKMLRVVNLLRVVFLRSPCDLLSRRTLCGHQFPGNYRHFPSPGRVRVVVNLGGAVKTLRRSNSLFLLSS